MPKCSLCDSQSFDILDGLYFCTDCGTQSQDIREEVHEDAEITTRQVCKGKKKSSKNKSEGTDLGKPWFTLEGYQILLKKQVEYLIGIGVNPKLKDVIGQMWFRFVQLSSNTFLTDDVGDWQKHTFLVERKRRRDNPKHDYVPVDSIHRPIPRHVSDEKQDLDALELSSEIAREEFYEDDDPTAGLFDDMDLDDEIAEENSVVGSSVAPWHTIVKSRRAVGYIRLPHTIAFCYLALLWLQEPICLSDLIRWVRYDHMPYCDVTEHFPSHMKFSEKDGTTFSVTNIPSKRNFMEIASGLRGLLSLPDFPEQNLNIYIGRFATDLQLPACIHRRVQALASSTKLDWSTSIPAYDDLAMVYIILSLKLIYGLDGKTEYALSELAVDIPANQNSSYVPRWSDLIELITICQTECAKRNVPFTEEELDALEDGRNYGEFCREKMFGSWQAPFAVNRYKRRITGLRGLNLEKREEYAKVFAMFLKKDGMAENSADLKDPSSFPLLCGKRAWLRNDMKEKQLSGNCHGLPEDSQGSTRGNVASHVTNPFQQIRKCGIPMKTISDYYSSRHWYGEVFHGVPWSQKGGPHQSSADDITQDRPTGSNDELPPRATTGSYRPQPPDIVSFDFPRCTIYKPSHLGCADHWQDCVLPASLKQLVEICAKLVESEPGILYTKLRDLEMVIDYDNTMSD